MDTIKSASISMLKGRNSGFLGKFSDSGSGIMDLDLYDFTPSWNEPAPWYATAHAMVLTVVHI